MECLSIIKNSRLIFDHSEDGDAAFAYFFYVLCVSFFMGISSYFIVPISYNFGIDGWGIIYKINIALLISSIFLAIYYIFFLHKKLSNIDLRKKEVYEIFNLNKQYAIDKYNSIINKNISIYLSIKLINSIYKFFTLIIFKTNKVSQEITRKKIKSPHCCLIDRILISPNSFSVAHAVRE